MAVTGTYVGTNTNGTGGTGFTFTSEPVGTANATRQTVVGVVGIQNGTGTTVPSSVTVGGSAATALATVFGGTAGGTSRAFAGFYSRANPSGTTATIVVTFANAMYECTIYVWSVVDADATPVDTTTQGLGALTNPFTVTLDTDTVADGFLVAEALGYDHSGGGSPSWSGVTSNSATIVYSDDRRSAASTTTVAATPRAVSVTMPGIGNSFAGISIAFAPAAAAGGVTKQMHQYRMRRA